LWFSKKQLTTETQDKRDLSSRNKYPLSLDELNQQETVEAMQQEAKPHKRRKASRKKEPKLVMESIVSSVKEIPTNPFDFIWDLSNLKENPEPIDINKHKLVLGARITRLNDDNHLHSNSAYFTNESVEIDAYSKPKKTGGKKKKHNSIVKKLSSKNEAEQLEQGINNFNLVLDDEFNSNNANKTQNVASSFGDLPPHGQHNEFLLTRIDAKHDSSA
jgi:hypothetical protein